jgi:hypothetical protein
MGSAIPDVRLQQTKRNRNGRFRYWLPKALTPVGEATTSRPWFTASVGLPAWSLNVIHSFIADCDRACQQDVWVQDI